MVIRETKPRTGSKPEPVRRPPRRRYLLPGHFVHVSARTLEGRYAFVPQDELFTWRVWGIVGRAMRRYGVELGAFVLLSNHFHALVRASRGDAISHFMQYVKAGLARLTHEYNGTSGTVWDGPYRSSNLLDDEAEAAWFRYILSHGPKEAIVASPRAWPGPHCAEHLYTGKPIKAVWLDRAAWMKAGGGDKTPFLRPVEVKLTPLTAFAGEDGVAGTAWREHCREVIDDIVAEHAEKSFLGVDAVRGLSTQHRPETVKRTHNVCFYAYGPEGGKLLSEAREARRNDVPLAVAAMHLLAERGIRGLEDRGLALPEACHWTPIIADALDDRAIVASFMPEPDPPGASAAA